MTLRQVRFVSQHWSLQYNQQATYLAKIAKCFVRTNKTHIHDDHYYLHHGKKFLQIATIISPHTNFDIFSNKATAVDKLVTPPYGHYLETATIWRFEMTLCVLNMLVRIDDQMACFYATFQFVNLTPKTHRQSIRGRWNTDGLGRSRTQLLALILRWNRKPKN